MSQSQSQSQSQLSYTPGDVTRYAAQYTGAPLSGSKTWRQYIEGDSAREQCEYVPGIGELRNQYGQQGQHVCYMCNYTICGINSLITKGPVAERWPEDPLLPANMPNGSPPKQMQPGDYGGGQCEHIVPFADMAIICGCASGKFRTKSKEFFKDIASSGINNINLAIYNQWQKDCWKSVYAWSHLECNQKKLNSPLVRFQISPNGKIKWEDDVGQAGIHIQNFCKQLHGIHTNGGDGDDTNAWNDRWCWSVFYHTVPGPPYKSKSGKPWKYQNKDTGCRPADSSGYVGQDSTPAENNPLHDSTSPAYQYNSAVNRKALLDARIPPSSYASAGHNNGTSGNGNNAAATTDLTSLAEDMASKMYKYVGDVVVNVDALVDDSGGVGKSCRAISGIIFNKFFQDKQWKLKIGQLMRKLSNGWVKILGGAGKIPAKFRVQGGGEYKNYIKKQTGQIGGYNDYSDWISLSLELLVGAQIYGSGTNVIEALLETIKNSSPDALIGAIYLVNLKRGSEEIYNFFTQFDVNGDGQLNIDELFNFIIYLNNLEGGGGYLPEFISNNLQEFFNKFDTDGNGLISLMEFSELFQYLKVYVFKSALEGDPELNSVMVELNNLIPEIKYILDSGSTESNNAEIIYKSILGMISGLIDESNSIDGVRAVLSSVQGGNSQEADRICNQIIEQNKELCKQIITGFGEFSDDYQSLSALIREPEKWLGRPYNTRYNSHTNTWQEDNPNSGQISDISNDGSQVAVNIDQGNGDIKSEIINSADISGEGGLMPGMYIYEGESGDGYDENGLPIEGLLFCNMLGLDYNELINDNSQYSEWRGSFSDDEMQAAETIGELSNPYEFLPSSENLMIPRPVEPGWVDYQQTNLPPISSMQQSYLPSTADPRSVMGIQNIVNYGGAPRCMPCSKKVFKSPKKKSIRKISKKQQEKTIINYLKKNKSSIKSLKDKNRKLKKTYRKQLNKKYKRINRSRRINKTKRINRIKTKRINKRNKKNKK